MATCPDCNEEIKGNPNFHAKKHSSVAVAERHEPRSRKARERSRVAELTPLQQIRVIPSDSTGAWCYYIRPGGATIRDVLGLSPNGGVPENADPKMRARFGMNHELYQSQMRAKGYIPIGSRLDQKAVRMIVDEIAKNREEAVWEMEDEIDECDSVIKNSDRPDIRDLYKRRREAAQKRLATLKQEFDPDALVAELDEISRGQRMAALPRATRDAIAEMVGEASQKARADIIAHFSRNHGRTTGDGGEDFAGKDFIDVD